MGSLFRLALAKLSNQRGQITTYGLVCASLVLLGLYRVVFNLVILGRGHEEALADVIFQFSYISIVTIFGAAGASAVYQRLTGEALARGESRVAVTAFWKGLIWCVSAPVILDGVIKWVAPFFGANLSFPESIPFLLAGGLYNFVKPLCFTFSKHRRYAVFEIGSILLSFLVLLLVRTESVLLNLSILFAPQAVVGIFGLFSLTQKITLGDFFRYPELSYKSTFSRVFWATLGVSSSMGLVFLLNLLGHSSLSAIEYSVYGTLLSMLAALNLFNRSLGLILLPTFTKVKSKEGQDASVQLLGKAFFWISLGALPIWFVLGAIPMVAQSILDAEIPDRIFSASLILILYSFVLLILSPLVNFNLGAGNFRTPQQGSIAGALLALLFTAITFPEWGTLSLATALLIAGSTNYVVNSVELIRRRHLKARELALSFSGQLVSIASYAAVALVFATR
ncbi:MAG: hypothetical protein AAGA58_08445 [Verrucomicrobiota bacterium]